MLYLRSKSDSQTPNQKNELDQGVISSKEQPDSKKIMLEPDCNTDSKGIGLGFADKSIQVSDLENIATADHKNVNFGLMTPKMVMGLCIPKR